MVVAEAVAARYAAREPIATRVGNRQRAVLLARVNEQPEASVIVLRKRHIFTSQTEGFARALL